MKRIKYTIILLTCLIMFGCKEKPMPDTFQYDLEFLQQHKQTIVLSSEDQKQQLVIVGDYQGRVMTSTSSGLSGKSYGWINYSLINSGKIQEHINVFGGEDRFWLGPEGGQFGLFFEDGKTFNPENWFTPKQIDTEPFELIDQSSQLVKFKKEMTLTNYSGFQFSLEVNRQISLLNKTSIEANLKMRLDENIQYVGFQSSNTITNSGSTSWTKENGLLSIWILGMFIPSASTTVIIPYVDSLELNTSYFGPVDESRLKITNEAVLFKGDGQYRCKIGLPPQNATPYFGSYDAKNNILTIVEYTFEGDEDYVNSLWELQDKPYDGDVINSYNDGPFENGDLLGPFYELESSSSSKELNPGESIKHVHKTYHFEGDFDKLNLLAKRILLVDLNEIKSIF